LDYGNLPLHCRRRVDSRHLGITGTDALWRTVATCVVVGVGTLAFSWLNSLFDVRDE